MECRGIARGARRLADTAGAEVVGAEWQNRRHIDPNWYLGKGKAEELPTPSRRPASRCSSRTTSCQPNQQKASRTCSSVKILDRSGLILDIFAQHARTHEGRLQVELAQLEYQLPRLTRMWTHLSRTGGGIGTRGPGETQLETDRRDHPRQDQEAQGAGREASAAARDDRPSARRRLVPTVAIVGYTNAGKSTLLNALTVPKRRVAEDRLFATLDPTSRAVKLGDGQSVIATDTVGFIHKLPHQLVDAFRATLEEVTRADVLLEVVDVSDRTRRSTADGAAGPGRARRGDKPRVVVYNKADLSTRRGRRPARRRPRSGEGVLVSALTGSGWTRCASASRRARGAVGGGGVAVPYSRRRAARAGPGAGHGRVQLPRARRAGTGARGAITRSRPAPVRRTLAIGGSRGGVATGASPRAWVRLPIMEVM